MQFSASFSDPADAVTLSCCSYPVIVALHLSLHQIMIGNAVKLAGRKMTPWIARIADEIFDSPVLILDLYNVL